MLETMAALGIVAVLLFAGLRMATLARAPGATAEAAAQLDAALALARSLARSSGNGATLLALPRSDTRGNALPGFRLVLYRGRPNAPGAASLTRELPLVADASLREASVGAPPFALFFRRDGSAVALARPSLSGSAAQPRFAIIAAEPPCPSATGLLLSVMRNGATVTRSIPCPVTDVGGLAAPQASMTPNPPTLAPPAVSFAWPSAPVQWFAIAEFGYRGWFAASGGAMESFTCRANGAAIVAFPNSPPYSGPQSLADARSVPSPPNGMPYAYAASASTAAGAMDDAPAHFPVHPIGAGLCLVPLADAFAQRKDTWGNPLDVAMRVMGWLALTNSSGATATSQTAPLSIASAPLTAGQSVTVNASKTFDDDPAGIAFAGLAWSPASCGRALAFTASGNNTAGSGATGTATHSFLITDSTPPATALSCVGSLTDQYNEPPVAFTVNVAGSGHYALIDTSGTNKNLACALSTLVGDGNGCNPTAPIAFTPRTPLLAFEASVAPWINNALGGGVADASSCIICSPSPIATSTPTSGCKSTAVLLCPSPGPIVTPTPCPTTSYMCAMYVVPSTPSVQFTQTGQTWSFTVGEMNLANGTSIAVTSSDPAAISVSPATGTIGATTFTLTAGTTSDAAVKILIQNTTSGAIEQMASLLLPTPSPSPGTSATPNPCGTSLSYNLANGSGTWLSTGTYEITWTSCKIVQDILVNSGNPSQFTGTQFANVAATFANIGSNGKPLCAVGDICVVQTQPTQSLNVNPCVVVGGGCSFGAPPVGSSCTARNPCSKAPIISGGAGTSTTTLIDLGPYVQDFVQVDASGNPIPPSGTTKPPPYPYPYQPGGTPPNECEQLAGPSGKPPCLDDTLFNIPGVTYPNSATNGNGTTKETLPSVP